MTETIQQLKEDIAILQEKLRKLEEKPSKVIALKYNGVTYIRHEGTPGMFCWLIVTEANSVGSSEILQILENTLKQEEVKETAQERGERIHKEVEELLSENENEWKSAALTFGRKFPVILPYSYDELPPEAWLEWATFTYQDEVKKLQEKNRSYKITDEHGETNPYKQYLNSEKEWEPSAQTPEQVEEGLRDAMRTAKEDGVFDTTKESWMNKPVEELVEMLEKNPPDCLKFVMGKTLEDIVTRWWCDIFSTNTDWDMETSIQDLCDRIFLWLPKEQDSSGTQRIETIVAVDTHNELLQKIKSKLHNKKI
jgi:hypothetical protein